MSSTPKYPPGCSAEFCKALSFRKGKGKRKLAWVLDLSKLGSLRSTRPVTAKDVQQLFGDPIPLHLGQDAIPVLDRWVEEAHGRLPLSIPGSDTEGPGRSPEKVSSMAAELRARALRGESFACNFVWRGKPGGRFYPYLLPGYRRALTGCRSEFDAAAERHGKHLLSSIRRDVRALLQAPDGWTVQEYDFTACHAALAVALSGDTVLAADVVQDVHVVTGESLGAPWMTPKQRRALGKAANCALLFGCGPRGLQRAHLGLFSHADDLPRWRDAWEEWWGRYAALRAFREEIIALVAACQRDVMALEIVSLNGHRSRMSYSYLKGLHPSGKERDEPKQPEEMWRSVFSHCFRAIEGDLLARTLWHVVIGHNRHGGKLALPIYDGMMMGAPDGKEAAVKEVVEASGTNAARELGIYGTKLVRKR